MRSALLAVTIQISKSRQGHFTRAPAARRERASPVLERLTDHKSEGQDVHRVPHQVSSSPCERLGGDQNFRTEWSNVRESKPRSVGGLLPHWPHDCCERRAAGARRSGLPVFPRVSAVCWPRPGSGLLRLTLSATAPGDFRPVASARSARGSMEGGGAVAGRRHRGWPFSRAPHLLCGLEEGGEEHPGQPPP